MRSWTRAGVNNLRDTIFCVGLSVLPGEVGDLFPEDGLGRSACTTPARFGTSLPPLSGATFLLVAPFFDLELFFLTPADVEDFLLLERV